MGDRNIEGGVDEVKRWEARLVCVGNLDGLSVSFFLRCVVSVGITRVKTIRPLVGSLECVKEPMEWYFVHYGNV